MQMDVRLTDRHHFAIRAGFNRNVTTGHRQCVHRLLNRLSHADDQRRPRPRLGNRAEVQGERRLGPLLERLHRAVGTPGVRTQLLWRNSAALRPHRFLDLVHTKSRVPDVPWTTALDALSVEAETA